MQTDSDMHRNSGSQRSRVAAARSRCADERGEGVISMAIAVLIVAFLGVAAWLAFEGLLDDTQDRVETQLERVGS